jgi:putative NADH-flavin reductase
MKIVVFGASGKVGRLVVDELVKRGYHVTAIVFREDNMEFPSGVRVLQLDVHDELLVREAIKGHNVVMSCLGSWGTKTKDILSAGMENIIPAMKHWDIKRIISLTGADARFAEDQPALTSRLARPVLKLVAPKILADGEKHLALLAASPLQWTVIRSPIMKNGTLVAYKLNNHGCNIWESITRASVVKVIVDEIENDQHIRQAPILHALK